MHADVLAASSIAAPALKFVHTALNHDDPRFKEFCVERSGVWGTELPSIVTLAKGHLRLDAIANLGLLCTLQYVADDNNETSLCCCHALDQRIFSHFFPAYQEVVQVRRLPSLCSIKHVDITRHVLCLYVVCCVRSYFGDMMGTRKCAAF